MLTWFFFTPMEFSNLSKPSFAAAQKELSHKAFCWKSYGRVEICLRMSVHVQACMCCEMDRQVGNIALFWTDCRDWKSIPGGTAAWQMNPASTEKVTSFLSLGSLSKSWWLL